MKFGGVLKDTMRIKFSVELFGLKYFKIEVIELVLFAKTGLGAHPELNGLPLLRFLETFNMF